MQDPAGAAAFQAIKPQFPEQEQHLKCPRCDSTNTKFCYYNNYNLSQPRHFCKNCRRYWTKGGALRNIPVGGGTRKISKRSSNTTSTTTGGSSSSTTNTNTSSKRPNPSTPIPTTATTTTSAASTFATPPLQFPKPESLSSVFPLSTPAEHDGQMLDIGGSFSSLLTSNGHFGTLLESFHHGGPTILSLPNLTTTAGMELASTVNNGVVGGERLNPPVAQTQSTSPPSENFLALQGDSNCWNGGGNGGGWPDLSIYTPGSSFQ